VLFLRISHADGLNRATGVRGYIEESRSGGTGIFGPARINLGGGFLRASEPGRQKLSCSAAICTAWP
jgi:hypothetical protein